MSNGCGCMKRPQEQEKPPDDDLAEAIVIGKRERQAVLQRVRRQRANALKRMATKYGSIDNDVD